MAFVHNVECEMCQSTVHKSLCDNPPAAGTPIANLSSLLLLLLFLLLLAQGGIYGGSQSPGQH